MRQKLREQHQSPARQGAPNARLSLRGAVQNGAHQSLPQMALWHRRLDRALYGTEGSTEPSHHSSVCNPSNRKSSLHLERFRGRDALEASGERHLHGKRAWAGAEGSSCDFTFTFSFRLWCNLHVLLHTTAPLDFRTLAGKVMEVLEQYMTG